MNKTKNSTAAEAEMSNILPFKRAATVLAPAHDDIARAAYLAWEKDGKPEGKDVEYWTAAEAQLCSAAQATNGTKRKNGVVRAA